MTIPGGRQFLRPEWMLEDRDGTLTVSSILTSRVVQFAGATRDEVLRVSQGATPALRAMGAIDPTVAAVIEAFESAPLEPWSRATLLRGSGWGQLFLELTARCNESCVHCYAESSPARVEELPLQLALAVLDDAKALGFRRVQLTGGDPLIARHVLEIAERVHALEFDGLEVYTNGLALDADKLSRLVELGAAFAFSFYSHDPGVHDRTTRTPGSQGRTLRAMERARSAGASTRVGIIVTDANREGTAETVEFLRELGFADGSLGLDVARGVGRGSYDPEIESIRQTLRQSNSAAQSSDAGHRSAGGGRFEGSACVAPDGAVYPCIFSRHAVLGNVHERRFADILEDRVPVRGPEACDDVGAWGDRMTCLSCRTRSAFLSDDGARGRSSALRVLQNVPGGEA